MIQGIIFDADGTLLDSMYIWDELGERYLRELGISAENGLSEKLFPMTLEESSAYLKKSYHLYGTTDDVKAGILDIIAAFYREEAIMKPGAKAFLQKLYERNIPMVIATSGDKALLTVALKRLKAELYFKEILTCSELGTSKREPAIYRAAAKAIGTDVTKTAVFEDTLFALQTAKNSGFITVAVEDSASENDKAEIQKTADYYMTNFSDFNAIWQLIEK